MHPSCNCSPVSVETRIHLPPSPGSLIMTSTSSEMIPTHDSPFQADTHSTQSRKAVCALQLIHQILQTANVAAVNEMCRPM